MKYSNYNRTELSDCLSVRYVESVWHVDLAIVKGGDEKHAFPEIFYVEEGSHKVYLDDIPYFLEKGQMIIYAPNAYHRGEYGAVGNAKVGIIGFEAEHCNLSLMCNRVVTLTDEQIEMLMKTIDLGVSLFEKISPSSGLVGMTPREGVTGKELQKLKHMLELFLIDVFGIGEAEEKRSVRIDHKKIQFENIVKHLKAEIDRALTLEDMATASQISVSGLSLLFKEQCGYSPIAYFNNMKIDEAQRLIRETDMNFTEISEAVGVGSIHYFSKLFKKKTGMTPTEYARSLKNK